MAASNQAGMVTELIEKHGVATFLLVAGAYFMTTSVVDPMVSTAQQFVSDIKETNDQLQKEIEQIDRENLSRWDASFSLHQEKKELIQRVLDKLVEIEADNRTIRSELEKTRMLFVKPFAPGSSNATSQENNTP